MCPKCALDAAFEAAVAYGTGWLFQKEMSQNELQNAQITDWVM